MLPGSPLVLTVVPPTALPFGGSATVKVAGLLLKGTV